MSKLKNELQQVHALIMENQPRTIEALINLVSGQGLLKDYGWSVILIHYMGCFQGIKLQVTGRKNHHYLPPEKENVYCAGYDEYTVWLNAGHKMVLISELEK